MVEYKKANYDDILAWCEENGKLEWLEDNFSTKFLSLKKAFYTEFFPDMLPKSAAPRLSMAVKLAQAKERAAAKAAATDNRSYAEVVADMNAANAAAKK